MKNIAFGILLIIFILVIAIIVFFFSTSGGLFGNCGIYKISHTVSPTSKYEVRVFKRDCGATTLIATVVAIREIKKKNEYQDLFILEGDLQITARWIDTTELLISSSSMDQESIYKKILHWNDVRVIYKLIKE